MANLLKKKSTSKSVLFVSHAEQQCGVHQEGYRIAKCLEKSEVFNFKYVECRGPDDYRDAIATYDPVAIIYNWYPSTLGWAGDHLLNMYPNIKHIGIFHEIQNPASMEYTVLLDPSATDTTPVFTTVPGKVFKTGRCLFDYEGDTPNPGCIVISSFGFGFGNKGYLRLVKQVCEEFLPLSEYTWKPVVIRLHMPFAAFGDADGRSSREQAFICAQEVAKHERVDLVVTHDFWPTQKLLKWLATSTINCFFYEHMYGRGISGCIDYALSVDRPIAITQSYMFRHILNTKPSICIEESSLIDIINRGTAPLQSFKEKWTHDNLRKDYENMLLEVLNV